MAVLVDEQVADVVDETTAAPQLARVRSSSEARPRAKAESDSGLYRFERKFFVSELSRREIEALIKLHPALFSELYHERFVNNIYFDTVSMENFHATIDGLRHRKKHRIRWYGDLFGEIDQPVLEIKSKRGTVGKKDNFPLPPFVLDGNFQMDTVIDAFKDLALPAALRMELLSLQPTLLNRYRRKYFQSADRQYRLTLDADLEYYSIKAANNTFLNRAFDRVNTIVELKYGNNMDQHAEVIASHFPFRITKSSKYITGIELLYS